MEAERPGLWRAIRTTTPSRTTRPLHLMLYGALDPAIEPNWSEPFFGRGDSRGVSRDAVPGRIAMPCLGMLQNNNETGRRDNSRQSL